jgi:hypothetical protein
MSKKNLPKILPKKLGQKKSKDGPRMVGGKEFLGGRAKLKQKNV